MYKGKTVALLPLAPTEIVQYEKELAEKKKNSHVKDSSKPAIEQSSNINVEGVLFALKSILVLADFDDHAPYYVLTCTTPICSIDPIPSAMPLVGTNLLQENEDKFSVWRPPWKPSLKRIGCQDEHLPKLPL
jgi:hypothetical protein